MQIHGGSEQNNSNLFLHAGYGSACNPRLGDHGNYEIKPFFVKDISVYEPVIVDLNEALRLKGEPYEATELEPPLSRLKIEIENFHFTDSFITFAIIGLISLGLCFHQFHLKKHLGTKKKYIWGGIGIFFGFSSFLSVFGAIYFEKPHPQYPPPPNTTPWESPDFMKQEYQNPQAATEVILYGLIKDALINCKRPIETAIRHPF